MNLRLRKTIATAAIVLTAGTSLAACGGDDSTGGQGDSSSVGEKASTELTQDNFFTEVAKAQQEAGTSHVETTFGVSGQEVTSTGDVLVGESPAETRMAVKASLGSTGSLDLRLVDEVLYLNLGPTTENKFAKVDLSDEDSPVAKQYNSLLANLDPTKQFSQLQDAVTGFEKKGAAQEIDGVEATPYEVTVDAKKVLGALDGLGAATAQTPDELVFTVFVGPDNLPRRTTSEVSGVTTTTDFSKWGEEVSIEAPAADQISDVDLSQMGAGVG